MTLLRTLTERLYLLSGAQPPSPLLLLYGRNLTASETLSRERWAIDGTASRVSPPACEVVNADVRNSEAKKWKGPEKEWSRGSRAHVEEAR